eukprot:CAMPEP_0204516902 /NCGR_PEP_ID=MMETSP0661-20131031/3384_1 /ASSEMBLY_ACC=CAM_ASM_000606 /TAXON_ID=109239 /ORGANISM="Alexandrium margalefi, Strain AMGDE01CS-322" /LENGTH=526 /DNA_ID=CAMNT_0051522283 /DNA_START=10 /DNA_END=1590 /DNA_ORIENTATION=-
MAPLHAGSLALLLGLTPRLAGAQEVLVGTAENFSRLVGEHEKLLVEFYAPWCGHCKALAPEYESAAAKLHEQGLETRLLKVDATVETSLAEQYGVSGYPDLKYFVDGTPQEYGGGRTADTIVSWLRKREVDAFEELEEADVEGFLAKTQEGEFAVVARVKKGSVRDKAFRAALKEPLVADYEASTLHFGLVYLGKGSDPKKDSSLTMRRPGFAELGEEVDVAMTGAWSAASVRKWVLESTFPTVAAKFKANKYSVDALEKLGFEAAVVAVLVETEEDAELVQRVRALLATAASKFPFWKFVLASHSDLESGDEELLATGGDDSLTVLRGKKKYLLQNSTGQLTEEAQVLDFLQQVRTGKAKPHYKSEPEPAQPMGEDHVLTVTGNTFEKLVLDPNKDVFVEFYAPWCGHCQKLTPEWSKLAKAVKSDGLDAKGVVIAKMDATANECDEEISGYPKLVLYPAVPKARKMRAKLQYSGQREFDPLLEFLLENSKGLEGVELKSGKSKESFDMTKRELQRKKGAKRPEL